jgi:tetratricopeptide (TPR) repeat protein
VEFEISGEYKGSACSFSISDKINDNKYLIDIEEANSRERGFMFDDDGIVNPQAYLGVFYPGCSVPIYIEAFDKEGRRLTSSVPLRAEYDKTPVVKVSEAGITEGDRLILENKPKEAIESYEKELVKDPNNIRILNILSRIYKIGTYVKFTPEKEERKDRDLDKAIELTERLYKITGNYEYKKRIAGIYFWDKKDYKKSLEEYVEIPEAMMDADDFDSAARLELLLLNFKKANEYYDRVYSMSKNINYCGLKPVVLKMYNRDFEGALKFLTITNMSIYHVDKERLKYDIEKIKGINAGNSDYENFQRALKIELTSNNSKDLQNGFTEIHGRIDDPILTEFLEQIAHYEYIIY